MYCLTETQVDYILNDIRRNGVEMEDLQLNLLDHICCIVEQEFKENDDFERFYQETVKRICNNGLHEIEDETINLLTFKNYYFMKKAMVLSGTLSVIAFVSGSLFKVLAWPGASLLLCLGALLLGLVFLPLVALLKTRENARMTDKFTTISGAVLGVLFCAAVLFAVQHWPGARNGYIWIATCAFAVFVFAPLYFFNSIRNAEKRTSTIMITVVIVGMSCLQFTMVGLRRAVPELPMYTYLNNEQILRSIQHSSHGAVVADEELTAAINNECEALKGMILTDDISTPAIPEDYEQRKVILTERLTTGQEAASVSRVLQDLKGKIGTYNASKPEASRIPLTRSLVSMTPGQIAHTTNLYLLNSLTQLQIHLAMSSHGRSAQATAMR